MNKLDISLPLILEKIEDPDILSLADLPSLKKKGEVFEAFLKSDPENWSIRQQLAWIIAGQRTSTAKRWAFNFEKALDLLRVGIVQTIGSEKTAELDELINHSMFDLVYHPMDDFLLLHAANWPLEKYEESVRNRMMAYLKLAKKKFTCHEIKRVSQDAIPRGQILTREDTDYWYDPPLETPLCYHFFKTATITNSTILQIASLMQIVGWKYGVKWDTEHHIMPKTAGAPLVAVEETKAGLRFDGAFLELKRLDQYRALVSILPSLRPLEPFSDVRLQSESGEVSPAIWLTDFNGLSLGVHLVKDILLHHGIAAAVCSDLEIYSILKTNPYKVFKMVGISLSDRGIEDALAFIGNVRLIDSAIPIIIGGAATLQYRELFAILSNTPHVYIFLGDSENRLPMLIELLTHRYANGENKTNELLRFDGLLYRSDTQIGFCRPEINSPQPMHLLLPVPENNKTAYDWNPNRGCPKRCAYCNNVQGKWRSVTLDEMKCHMLAIVGHLAGFSSHRINAISNSLKEKIGSLESVSDFNNAWYPVDALHALTESFFQSVDVSKNEVAPYLAEGPIDSHKVSRVCLYKRLLILNGLEVLKTAPHRLKPYEKSRINLFTASDNFLVETEKIGLFYDWLIQLQLPRYFFFRTQTSLDFLWNFSTNSPNCDLMQKMLAAGILSMGFGYDSSANAIGRCVLKRNTYNMMIKILDALVQIGYDRTCLRIHHFYSSPSSTFEETLEGLLLKELNIANDRGNMIARVLYTYRSELGMLMKMGLEERSENPGPVQHVTADNPIYNFIHSEARALPIMDKKASQFLDRLFALDPKTQEFEAVYDRKWLFASCFETEIQEILHQWLSKEIDPEIHSAGIIIRFLREAFEKTSLMHLFQSIKALLIQENIFSFERLLKMCSRDYIVQQTALMLREMK